jgi:ubiquinone/menaquinone biosynthesis C-methylase UbiE
MSQLAKRLQKKYFGKDTHPFRVFEQEVHSRLVPGGTLVDVGCGRTAPVLQTFRGHAARLIGIDLVEFEAGQDSLELYHADLGHLPLPDQSVDVVMARSVMEHIQDPRSAYAEVCRVLKPGGAFVFLTANLWDYGALIALAVPNRFHPWIVSKTEGRAEEDVFPVVYRTNTHRAVKKWASGAAFDIARFDYLGQYPSYFMFNGGLFWVATQYEKLLRRFHTLRVLQGWILVTLVRRQP